MSYIQKNMWGIGLVVLFVGALVAMWAAGRGTSFPSPTGPTAESSTFEITENDHIYGKQDAKVTIVEFSDFQCPACKSYAPVLEQIVDEFPEDVRLVYKHFPLKTVHFRAESAARASEAAALQGKFWEMNKLLFENQDVWSKGNGNSFYNEYAKRLSLDIDMFKKDIESDKVKEAVNKDFALALSLNLNATPTIYVNGKKITNPGTYDELRTYIQTEIQSAN
jgi:protein-disulfide isomerase